MADKSVSIAVSMAGFYGREAIRGILRYCREKTSWELRCDPDLDMISSSVPGLWPAAQQIDGMIVQYNDPRLMAAIQGIKVPIVNISSAMESDAPSVTVDNLTSGKLAARHFLDNGFRHFGFIGNEGQIFSQLRQQGFNQELQSAGAGPCATYLTHNLQEWYGISDYTALTNWLRSLPKPAGVLCCHDAHAVHVVNAAVRLNLTVPDEIAIVGVDNDDLLCSTAPVPVSSVAVSGQRIGYMAAEMLDQLMSGHTPAELHRTVEPLGLIVRQSSDIMANNDPHVTAAIQFIREHAAEPINVRDILQAVPICRRNLERRFLTVLNRSPADEIARTRVEIAKRLLAETDMKVPAIGLRSGFNSYQVFFNSFHRSLGVSPTEYRKRVRQETWT